ncbi:MAG: PTS IIA-like nitrogen-regulatory protein PtsN [OM182 bacterium MED-G28]|uniref:PTS IIA-like nitrogen-regulatory protein PtsN n=1 Tax=OM182 bacterium MED-G28 TaxID=1986256 RepID=A0A2A5W9R3_9GAMM|nr:MAG: PTS IIA-like nitrogen-regulatory protein PtsN [OM182 bacterium MED-G28]
MQLKDFLTRDRCYCRIEGVSKKRLLENISKLLSKQFSNLDDNEIFNAIMAREQLGSTGLGNGIAVPHCRVPHCETIIGALITLENAIDFDAIDGKKVDLIFLLIVPEEKTDDHIKALGGLAELFNDPNFCSTIRQAQNSSDLYKVTLLF